MDNGIAEVRERARHAGIAHLAPYSDFEPAEADFFPGSRPARLADNGKVRSDAMIEHVGDPATQTVVLTGLALGGHRRHAAAGKGQQHIAVERHPSRADATRRLSEGSDHAFGIGRAETNNITVGRDRAVREHVRTQFWPNPGDVCVWVSAQMGVDRRIQEQCWATASAFELPHSIARALVKWLIEGVYPQFPHLLH